MSLGRIAVRTLSFGAPVAGAVALLVLGINMREGPRQAPPTETSRIVRVITLKPTAFVPSVVGYGAVKPARTWNAVAQVAGRIEYIHPALRTGAILKAGTEVIRISPKDYDLAVAEAEANLKAAEAKLVELELQQDNARRSRALETRTLELQRNDLTRKKNLLERGNVSQATVDETERAVLSQQVRVQDIENTLRLSPAQIDAQKRQIEVSRAQLETARLNKERTRIALPFDARIASVNVERTQFVAAGTELAEADDISEAEVDAQIPLTRFGAFARVSTPADFKRPQLEQEDAVRKAIERIGWTAKIRLRFSDRDTVWNANVLRTSDTIDPTTRSIGVIVSVTDPYTSARPGIRPPLVKGTFVQVELSGRALDGQIVVPRAAVHGDFVYIADAENRLRIKKIKVRVAQDELVLVESGLKAGDRLILTDVAPAVDGMLLDPVTDDKDGAASTAAARPVTNRGAAK
ncbi:MAG: HlyD family efflux transporter periplasmic adaptor subunit [Pseudomonadota bacterium]